jgi:peptidoglycan/LPS O-acetylase OafA/YrhL
VKKRNSLIELYRFIFAVNVIKGHDMFPYSGPYFGFGRISVEFFFILTGFLLMGSIRKFLDKSFKEGFISFMISKIKGIWIPIVIAIPFNIVYSLLTKNDINMWGFLWYVKQMLIYFAVYFLIRYFIKDEKKFFVIVAITFVVATILNMFDAFYERGDVRAAMGISLGILISYIPKLNIKKKGLIWLFLAPIQIIVILILIFGNNFMMEKVLDLILYPLLIYFTFQLDARNKIFDYLGSLSFGLYAFQCVVRPLPFFGINNTWILFGIIVMLSILEDSLKRYLNYLKVKKATA